MEPNIEVKGISKSYHGKCVVKDISFTVSQGEVFGILGHNGAGKTTLVEIMLGLKKQDVGTAKILGQPLRLASKHIFERIGVQLQHAGYQNNIKVMEACEERAAFYRHSEDIVRLLKQFHLYEQKDQLVEKLSGGERQKLSLVHALISQPEVIFLDELTTGLDPYARKEVWELLKERKAQGTTIVMTSHYLDEVEALCDRIMIMKQGQCMVQGTISEVLQASHHATLEEAYMVYGKEEER